MVQQKGNTLHGAFRAKKRKIAEDVQEITVARGV